MSELSISLLGPFVASVDNHLLSQFRTKTVQALLIYLVCEKDTVHQRETLMNLLWPEVPLASAQANLRQTLYRLRKTIPEVKGKDGNLVPFLLTERQIVQVNPEADYFVDIYLFLASIKYDPTQAIALYRGDFLADFYLPESEKFEEWAATQRVHYRRQMLTILNELTVLNIEQNKLDEAEKLVLRQLKVDDLRESAHRQLIEVLAKKGRRRAALSHYDKFTKLLRTELDIQPSKETTALATAIRTEMVSRSKCATLLHNLPTQMTRFIGREAELATLNHFVASDDVRLITIVGPGGIGKTRLVLAFAQAQIDGSSSVVFTNGIFFINLASLTHANQILSALATSLDFPLQSQNVRSPRQQLLDYLHEKRLLLLFDNFEHVIEGVDLVTDILQAAPYVKILVTSREPLRLQAEQLYPIRGLLFPASEKASDAESYTAVQLFLQSARRNQPHFTLRDLDDLTHLIRICRLVGGMPLAIELAAAWVDKLSLADIATEIQKSLDFLETDMHDISVRHRSVKDMIDYSWHKLTDKERTIFVQLSVFRGGFTRQAAQEITRVNLQQIARLVNRSFLQYDHSYDRYQIHELMRQFGAEKLAKNVEQETATNKNHCLFYLSALQKWEADLKTSRQSRAIIEIETDYRNILIAWNYALTEGYLEKLCVAISCLGEFYNANGRWGEGQSLFEKTAVSLKTYYKDSLINGTAARLLVWLSAWQASLIASLINAHPSIQYICDQLLWPSLALLEKLQLVGLDTRSEEAFLRLQLGRLLRYMTAGIEKGEAQLKLSFSLYQELKDETGLADVLYESHFYAYDRGLLPKAYQLLQQNLAWLRQKNDPRRLVRSLIASGVIAHSFLTYHEATDLLNQAYTIAQADENLLGMEDARRFAAHLARFYGQFDLALKYLQEALILSQQANNWYRVAFALEFIAITQIFQGQFKQALALAREDIAVKSRQETGWPLILPLAYLHLGQYEKAELLSEKIGDMERLEIKTWAALARADYAEAKSLAQSWLEQLPPVSFDHRSWGSTALGYALYKLEQTVEAKWELYQDLQTAVSIKAFSPLMYLMPILSVVLADTTNIHLKTRAVELYAMAESSSFIRNSQLFADIAGKPVALLVTTLPTAVLETAQARGRELDWWPTAESLLTELTTLGWGKDAD